MSFKKTRIAIGKSIEEASELPPTVAKVLKFAASPDATPRELARIIRLDPILSFQVLRLVNSAVFGIQQDITSVQKAVVLLGINTVRNLALSLGLASKLRPDQKQELGEFNQELFWRHSLGVAIVSTLIARKMGVSRTEQEHFFIAGLLHDVGKMIIFNTDSELYAQALKESHERMTRLHVVERERLGLDHMEVGKRLIRKWKLDTALISYIQEPEESENEEPLYDKDSAVEESKNRLARVVELANDYAQRLGYGIDAHHHKALPLSFWQQLDLEKSEVDAYIEEELDSEFERAKSFLDTIAP